ncbi:MAG TPA: hypothetical protein PKX92_12875 [Edaphocola sp.]|nr:hypothetical protein [Edaphocola sp.]
MRYRQIISILNNEKTLTHEEEENIRKHFQFAKSKKYEIVLPCNSVCDKIFFINKGIIRAHFSNEKGKNVTRVIASENHFLTNMISFRTLSRSIEAFECLEDTEYIYITKGNLNALLERSPLFRIKYCEILEIYNANQINHIHSITNSDVCAKIQYLKSNYSNIIGRVSDQILASFIGVSRETIGRNKNQLQ